MTRPPIGTRVRLRESGKLATVIPTHWQAPDDEVDVMFHGTGSVMTVHAEWFEVLNDNVAAAKLVVEELRYVARRLFASEDDEGYRWLMERVAFWTPPS